MSVKLLIVLGILFVITIILTMYAFYQEEKKLKKYEEEGDTIADEIRRSHEYENKSIGYHVPIQIWIYVVFFAVTIIGFVVYLYFN